MHTLKPTNAQMNVDPRNRRRNRADNTRYEIPYRQSHSEIVYAFTGTVQTFTAPVDGVYRFECTGSAGGFGNTTATNNGHGAYATGEIRLACAQTLYVCVGQQAPNHISYAGSWNGGGPSPKGWNSAHHGGAGGGASDIRLASAGDGSTDWETGLRSRIIVAAGGGGAVSKCGKNSEAGHGGTLTSANIKNLGYGYARTYHVNGATQYQGGIGYGTSNSNGSSVASQGLFGKGVTFAHCNGGGGGGWYGGASAYVCGGSGGSSYIKDYPNTNTQYVEYQNELAGYDIEIKNANMQSAYWNSEGFVRIVLIGR